MNTSLLSRAQASVAFAILPSLLVACSSPSPTRSVDFSADVLFYTRDTTDSLERVADASNTLVGLLEAQTAALERQQTIVDESWHTDAAAEIAVFQRQYELLKAMEAPRGLEELHATLLSAVGECRDTIAYLPSEPDALSLENLRIMLELISGCTEQSDVALAMMSELLPSPDAKP